MQAQKELRQWLAASSARYLRRYLEAERREAAQSTLNINPLKDPTAIIAAQERHRFLTELLQDENLLDALVLQIDPEEEAP